MVEKTDNLLDQINDPSELRKLKVDQLPEVCNELRDYIIDAVSTNPVILVLALVLLNSL